MAGLKRYRGQYAAGKVGKEVHSRSGRISLWDGPGESLTGRKCSTSGQGPQLPANRTPAWNWGRHSKAGPSVPINMTRAAYQGDGGFVHVD